LASFVKLATPLLAAQGAIIAMRGEVDQIELDKLRSDAPEHRCHIEVKNYKLPSIDAQRSIVIIRPNR
jgi:16S rRNA G527 N7-methylase RsmG